MIGKDLLEAITRQINREIYSAYFYAAMASYAEANAFKGVANWFKVQVREELEHAEKMYNYINKQGKRVMMQAIEEPPQDFTSIEDLFKKTLEHEKKVTQLIKNLVDLSRSQNDKEADGFLQWFVKEQVEEEATPAKILQKIRDAGTSKEKLLQVDKELGQRK
jgi:ferritin